MNKINKNITIIVLIAIAVVAILSSVRSCSDAKRKEKASIELINALGDSLKVTINKLGQQEAKIKVIETEDPEIFLKLQTKDAEIAALQHLVKNNIKDLISASIIKTHTDIIHSAPTTIIKTDTVENVVYPTYHAKIDEDGWIVGTITANKDSITPNLRVHNEYDVVIKEEKGVPYANITNKNPFSSTTTYKTYNVTVPKPSNFGVGAIVGPGISTQGTFHGFVGVGIYYNFFRF